MPKYRVYIEKVECDSFTIEVEDENELWDVAKVKLSKKGLDFDGWEITEIEPE